MPVLAKVPALFGVGAQSEEPRRLTRMEPETVSLNGSTELQEAAAWAEW